MKKKYITPDSIIIDIDVTNQVCAGSAVDFGGNGGGRPAEAPSMRGRGWEDYENN